MIERRCDRRELLDLRAPPQENAYPLGPPQGPRHSPSVGSWVGAFPYALVDTQVHIPVIPGIRLAALSINQLYLVEILIAAGPLQALSVLRTSAAHGEHPYQVVQTRCPQLLHTKMCSGSEAGSYLRRIDFVYHSTLGSRVIIKKMMKAHLREVAHVGGLQVGASRRDPRPQRPPTPAAPACSGFGVECLGFRV